jgi:hypothetical protein
MAAGLGFKTFTTGEVLTAADTNGYLMQGVLVFASAAARDAAITSPQEGQCCYLKDTDAVLTYSGAAWVGFDDSNAVQNSIVDAKGDLIAASAADTPARLAVGNNGETLVADSAQATGLRYRSAAYSAKTAAYTFVSGDDGKIFSMNAATSVQFNIPTDATFDFPIGTEITVFWITGAGQPTIGAVTPGTTTVISTGATSATPKLRVANSGATCKKLAANSWIVFGDIA